jgi:hypothetical protein
LVKGNRDLLDLLSLFSDLWGGWGLPNIGLTLNWGSQEMKRIAKQE